jgi:amino acid permease
MSNRSTFCIFFINYISFDDNDDNDCEHHRLLDERIESFVSVSTTTTVGTMGTQQLPQQPGSETTIILGSIANLCSATLGAGVLALPYAIYQSGIIIGCLLLITSAAATVCSIDLIACACHVYGANTYESLTDKILGKNYRRAVECSIVLFSIGCAIAYVIAVGDILDKSHMILIGNSRNWTVTVVWLFALVTLSMLRTMQTLQFASGFGIFSILILVIGASIHLYEDVQIDIDTADTNNTITDVSDVLYNCLWPTNGIISIITACPIIIFAFSCQCNVCAIFTELPDHIQTNNNNPNSERRRNIMVLFL